MGKKILLLFIEVMLLTGCFSPIQPSETNTDTDVVSAATEERYRDGELREYNGEMLDPAVGPRDNSIKGTQTVDISSYELIVDGLVNQTQTYTYDDVINLPSEERLLRL